MRTKQDYESMDPLEAFDNFITVGYPSLWILLAVIIILLFSFFLWCIFGSLKTTISIESYVRKGFTSTQVFDDKDKIKIGMDVYLKDKKIGEVISVQPGSHYFKDIIIKTTNLADGNYTLDIVIEDINCISFLMN